MKFIKISLYAVVGIFVVVMLVAGGILANFDTDKYEAIISKEVKKATGRELTIGDIQLSLFPWLGFEVQQLVLSNAPGFDEPYMAKIERMDAHVEIMALFAGEVRIDTVQVQGLQLSLGKNKKAQTNWDDILQKLQTVDSDRGKKVKGEATANESDSMLAVLVNGVELKNAAVQWHDASTGQSVFLKPLNLQTGAIRSGAPLPFSLSADISLSEPQAGVKLDMTANIEFDSQAQQLKVNGVDIKMGVSAPGVGLAQANLKLKMQVEADLKKQVFELTGVVLSIEARDKSLPNGAVQAAINTGVYLDLQQQTASIKNLNIQSAGLDLQIQANASQLSDTPRVKGELILKWFNPADVVKKLGVKLPATASKQVLKSASMRAGFSATKKMIKLESLLVNLDKSSIKGGLSVRDFNKPAIKYQLALDQINLDDYLPPAKKATTKNTKTAAKGVAKPDTPIDLPVEMLRDLNVSGEFTAGKVQAFGQMISTLRIATDAKGGLINIRQIKARLLEGQLNASAQLDVRKNTPYYAMRLKATGINADAVVSPILQEMLGKKEVRLSGASNVSLDVNSSGKSVNQLTANSNGQFKFNMGKAQLYGVDAEYFVRQGVIGYLEKKKKPVPEKWRIEYRPKETTALKKARATAVIRRGVIDNRDLLLDSSRFKITGEGKINLVKEVLDYRAVVDVNPGRTKTAADRLLDVPMPVFVRGSFAQPKISIDSKVWLKSVGKELKAEAKKEIKQAIKKEKKKRKDKLKNKLRGLFK